MFDPPDDLTPALAGALAANGRPGPEHAMAALIHLADRREIAIAEEPRGTFGQRRYAVRRLRGRAPLAGHEQILVDAVFEATAAPDDGIPLTKARSRIASRLRRFSAEVRRELADRGLMDEDRRRVRDRLGRVSIGLLVAASAALIGAGLLAREFGPWTLAVPGALFLVAMVGFIVQGATTPLSDEGLVRADRWRTFGRHLKEVAHDRVHAPREASTNLLGMAIALGLASAWSKYLKQHPATAPSWYQALSAADDGGFPAFVATWGAANGGGGAGSGGAGGGASGAG